MMGRTHALTGIVGSVGITGFVVDVSGWEAASAIILCTGAALLPDIDHPKATVSNTYGPLTRVLSWIMCRLTGGHRRGTHSVMGIGILGAVTMYAAYNRDTIQGKVILSVIMILTLASAVRLLKIPGWIDDFLPIPIVLGIVFLTPIPLYVVPPAIVAGCLIHVAGDMVTKTGCPVWWPMNRKNYKVYLFKTNGWGERRVVTPVLIAVLLAEVGWWVLDSIR